MRPDNEETDTQNSPFTLDIIKARMIENPERLYQDVLNTIHERDQMSEDNAILRVRIQERTNRLLTRASRSLP
jgi:hypothetical protein